MPDRSCSDPTLADLAALALALSRDEQLRDGERAQRDRVFAARHPIGDDRAKAAVGWLSAVQETDLEVRTLRERVDQAAKASNVIIVALGGLLGWATTLAVFYYDGTHRVNVLTVLAVLVLIPALLLVPFVLATLPRRALAWLPGAPAVIALCRALSPGRIAPGLMRFFPSDWREACAQLTGRARSHQTLYAGVQSWTVLRWSQLLALAFQVAAVVTALGLVAFTDLAFGWSTTLTTGNAARDAERVHAITTTLAIPWSWALADAKPSLPLIEHSRYYRAVAATVTPDQAAQLGGWWRFLVLTMLVYGLVPRVVTAAVTQIRLRAKVRTAFAETPGLTALLRRLHRAQLQTTADEPEQSAGAPPQLAEPSRRDRTGTFAVGHIINWSAVPIAAASLSARFSGAPVHAAGGASELAADEALIAQLRSDRVERHGVVIVVKAWEPPLLELIDFIRALRPALGEGREILVVPVACEAAQPVAPSAQQREVWRRALGRVGDPWLHVGDLPGGTEP
jgi:hypothetical protein